MGSAWKGPIRTSFSVCASGPDGKPLASKSGIVQWKPLSADYIPAEQRPADGRAENTLERLKTDPDIHHLQLDNSSGRHRDATLPSYRGELIAGILRVNPAIKTLGLHEALTVKDIRALARVLKTNTTLESLDLSRCEIASSGMAILLDALKTNTGLKHLCLNDVWSTNNWRHGCPPGLTEMLAVNTHLRTLDLTSSSIDNDGAFLLADALKKNPALKTLILSRNGIGNEGAIALAAALDTNTHLMALDISRNKLGDRGAAAFAQALRTNRSLWDLRLEHNTDMTRATFDLFVDSLKINPALVSLALSYDCSGPIVAAGRQKGIIYTDGGASLPVDWRVVHDIQEALKHARHRNLSEFSWDKSTPLAACLGNIKTAAALVEKIHAGTALTMSDLRELRGRLPAVYCQYERTYGDASQAIDAVRKTAAEHGIELESAMAPLVDAGKFAAGLDALRRLSFTQRVRRKPDFTQSLLYQAVAAGQFEQIIAAGNLHGEKLTVQDYMMGFGDEEHPGILELLTQQGYLPLLFDENNWYDFEHASVPFLAALVPHDILEKQLGESFKSLSRRMIEKGYEPVFSNMTPKPSPPPPAAPPAPKDSMPYPDFTDAQLKALATGELLLLVDTPPDPKAAYIARLEWRTDQAKKEIGGMQRTLRRTQAELAQKSRTLEQQADLHPKPWSERIDRTTGLNLPSLP